MVAVVGVGAVKYQVVAATLGAKVILLAPPVIFIADEIVCLAPAVAAENLSVLPSVVSFKVAVCNLSAKVIPPAELFVTVKMLNGLLFEVIVCPLPPLRVIVEVPAVGVMQEPRQMPVRFTLPETAVVDEPRSRMLPVPAPEVTAMLAMEWLALVPSLRKPSRLPVLPIVNAPLVNA